jgi:hypothetical protein
MYVTRIHGNGAKKKLPKLFYRTPYTVSDSSQNFFVGFKHTSLVADDKRVKKLRCFSPRANYTDRATAACRRS